MKKTPKGYRRAGNRRVPDASCSKKARCPIDSKSGIQRPDVSLLRGLNIELEESINAVRAKKPQRLPTVLNKEETHRLLNALSGTHKLMAMLLYGSGLRVAEAVSLRVKDIDFDRRQLTIRDGKGAKDRMTVLPDNAAAELKEHLIRVRLQHDDDLSDGFGRVYLPYALSRKFKNAEVDWLRQYIFPSKNLSKDPKSGEIRRHHVRTSSVQKAVRKAARLAKIAKTATATPSGTASRPTCWRTGMTSGRYRSFSAIKMSIRQ